MVKGKELTSIVKEENENKAETFGKFIKQKRAELRLTQKEFGDLVGLSEQSIRDYEHMRYTPSPKTALNISAALDIKPNKIHEVFKINTLGNLIKIYRIKKGLTQEVLAKNANISDGRISKYELNTKKPKYSTIVKIAEKLSIPLEKLKSFYNIHKIHNLGDLIRVHRFNKGLSQIEVAHRVNLNSGTISSYECNNSRPNYSEICKIAQELNIPLEKINKFYKLDKMNTLGNLIRVFRLKKGWTKLDLANKVDLSASTIGAYESDRKKPNYNNVIKLSQKLKIPLEEIAKYRPDLLTKENFYEFIKGDEAAQRLLALGVSGSNGTLSDAVEDLGKLYPTLFSGTSAFDVPRWVYDGLEGLLPYLGPFMIKGDTGTAYNSLKYLQERFESSGVSSEHIEELIFKVVKGRYMIDFNRNPKNTLKTIRTLLGKETEKSVRKVLQKTYDYFEEVAKYKIPGIEPILEEI